MIRTVCWSAMLSVMALQIAYATDAESSIKQNTEQTSILNSIKQEMEKPLIEQKEHITIERQTRSGQVNLAGKQQDQAYQPPFHLMASEYTIQPERFDDIVHKAYEAVQVGHLEAALALYKKAQVLDPNNIPLLYAMGSIYHKLRQLEQANKLYKQVLLQDPSNHKALTNYLTLLADTSPEKALIELKSLEQINNNFAPVVGQIGMLYAKQGRYDDAISYLQRALALEPNELYYRYNLAVAYDQKGETKKARQLYYDVVERSQNNNVRPPVGIGQIIQRIKNMDTTGQ